MKRHIDYIVSIVLIFLIGFTAITGYIQSELELRKFFPHKYFAYATLIFVLLHLIFKWKKLINYILNCRK